MNNQFEELNYRFTLDSQGCVTSVYRISIINNHAALEVQNESLKWSLVSNLHPILLYQFHQKNPLLWVPYQNDGIVQWLTINVRIAKNTHTQTEEYILLKRMVSTINVREGFIISTQLNTRSESQNSAI